MLPIAHHLFVRPKLCRFSRTITILGGGVVEKADHLPVLPSFFDRRRELHILATLLDQAPKLTTVLGEPSSGKSNLINKALAENSSDVIYLNMREAGFQDFKGLYAALNFRFTSVFTKIWEKAKIGVKFPGLEINEKDEQLTLHDFQVLLQGIGAKLADLQSHAIQKKPVFFVDEASELRELVKTEEGQGALRTFLKWLTLSTKERRQFHCILSTSDPLFLDWLAHCM